MGTSDGAFFDLTLDLLAVVDADLRLQRVNPAWTGALGWGRDELIGMPLADLVDDADDGHLRATLDQVQTHRPLHRLELALRARTGGLRAIEWNLARSPDDGMIHAVGRDVTEARRQSRLLRLVEDATRVGSFEIPLDTSELRWSRITHEIYGTDPHSHQPTLEHALSRYPPEARAVLDPALDALMTRGEPYDLITPFVTLAGDRRWVRSRATAEWRDGQVAIVYGTFEDVTEAREEHLRLARFREIVELGRDGVWEATPDGITTYANGRMAQLLETTVEALQGTSIFDHVDDADHATIARSQLQREDWSPLESFQIRLRTRTGRPTWVNVASRPRLDENGAVVALTAMVTDLTEMRSKEQQLRRSEARLRTFVELAPLGIVRHDLETGAVLEANRSACEMAGLPLEALRGRAYADLLEFDPDVERAASEQVVTTGRFGPIEVAFARPDDTRLAAEVTGVALPGDDGRLSVWTLIRDVTEHRRLERLKDEFVATVSHELRTPLSSISGALELLTRPVGIDGDRRDLLLRVAVRNAERLAQLIDDILDVSRLDATPFDVEVQPHDLGAVAAGAVEAAEGAAAAADVGLRVSIEPTDGDGLAVLADEARLQQAIGNLLSNAIRFSPTGGAVQVRVVTAGDRVELQVRDHGPGVPEGFAPRMFERFAQADASDRRVAGGTGLGLSIVRAVVERHRGRVVHDAPPDGGARFTISLPAVPTSGVADDDVPGGEATSTIT